MFGRFGASIIVSSAVMALAASEARTQVPAPAPTQPAAAPVAGQRPPVRRECTRLPLSDIQFGREETIASARKKLIEEYAPKVTKERGWKSFAVSNETSTCEDYLYIPLLGQEYKCLVTLTFCRTG